MPTPEFRKTLRLRSKRAARIFNHRTGALRKHQPRLTPITEEHNTQNHSPIIHRKRKTGTPERPVQPIPPPPAFQPRLTRSATLGGRRRTLRK